MNELFETVMKSMCAWGNEDGHVPSPSKKKLKLKQVKQEIEGREETFFEMSFSTKKIDSATNQEDKLVNNMIPFDHPDFEKRLDEFINEKRKMKEKKDKSQVLLEQVMKVVLESLNETKDVAVAVTE